MKPTPRKPFALNGFHASGMIVAFFAVIIGVDVAMAVAAYRTFPGEVSARPYEDGLAFNSTLAKRDKERALGWRARIATTVGELGRVNIKTTITDSKGAPVRGLSLEGKLERPATETGRIDTHFVETTPGVYQASISAIPGAWDVTLSGHDAHGRPFEAERRLTWR